MAFSLPTLWFRRPRMPKLNAEQLECRTTPAFMGGVNLAVGDVNGDSYLDIIAAQANNGEPLVRIIDGQTGKINLEFYAYEKSFTGGVYVAAGDLDGDGKAEIITGTGNTGGPNVSVFNGSTGTLLYGFFPYEDSFRGGVIVAAGDTNGDGKAEIITGTGVGGGPRVQIIDASTKQAIADFFAYEDTFRGGVLVGAGDLNGDGNDEIVTGTGVGGGPRVQAVNASTLEPVLNFFAYEDSFRGGVLVGVGDMDGDGFDEVITGTGPGGGPVVTAFGSDAKERSRFVAYEDSFRGGVNITTGDLNADSLDEIITGPGANGLPTVNVFGEGGVSKLYSLSPFDPVQLPSKAPLTSQFNVPVDGATFDSYAVPTGLTVSPTTVLTGSGQQLFFTANFAGSPLPSQVQLYQSNSAGAVGEFLLNLYDDGLFSHRDSESGDGLFSNTFIPTFPTAGDQFYLAKATYTGSTKTQTTKLVVRQKPTTAQLTADFNAQQTLAANLQDQLTARVKSGTPISDALNQTRDDLLNQPSMFLGGSVEMSGRGVYWESPLGQSMGVLTTTRTGNEWSGSDSSSATASTSSSSTTTHECQGKALILEPYILEGVDSRDNSEGDYIKQILERKGYQVDRFVTIPGHLEQVTVESYKNISRYDAVVFIGHGDQKPKIGDQPVILTNQKVSLDSYLQYSDDVLARPARMTEVDGVWALTPAFFQHYSGQMHHESLVYMASCRSFYSNGFANVFKDLGAGAAFGYTDYVDRGWSRGRGVELFRHVVKGEPFASFTPGSRSEPDTPTYGPEIAKIEGGWRTLSNKLDPHCDSLADYDLFVEYTWPSSQKDLDTGTQFLGKSVGFSHTGSPYMTFSGDNTNKGGSERITINMLSSFQAGAWTKSVDVDLRAGWYSPSKGAGEALVTVSLKHKTEANKLISSETIQIQPGSQSGAATTLVGRVTVFVSGPVGEEEVYFEKVEI